MIHLPDFMRLAMLAFCEQVMTKPCDLFVGAHKIERWILTERGKGPNCYIHRFHADDEDGALHDHRYDNVTAVLSVGYWEHFHVKPLQVGADGKYETVRYLRTPGQLIRRSAAEPHRITVLGGEAEAVTMFFCGPEIRDWGFHCPSGWVDWRTFLGGEDMNAYAKKGHC